MKNISKNLMLWAIIILTMIVLFNLFRQEKKKVTELKYSEFISSVELGKITEVTIDGRRIKGTLGDEPFTVIDPGDQDLIRFLKEKKVQISAKITDENWTWKGFLITWIPFLLIIVLWVVIYRQIQTGGGKALSFGKSRARLLTESQHKVTFKDVAGIDEAKNELEEIIEFLRDPQKFTRLGGRIPKGVLLVGPPGTGKTLLARAIAGEAEVPFFSISGSDFVEMFVGVGASRVRDLFNQGKKHAPCIIFIDEIDAVGRQRGAGLGGGHDEREQTLNQLLVEMDGFESNEGVILISATNRPDVLDPALLRPGRFDRRVVVHRPDLNGRVGILKVHTRKTPLADDVNLETIGRGTPGFSGADLENLVNEAALLAARKNQDNLKMPDFEEAKDKVLMGVERKSMIINEEEKRLTAYHESGHTLAAKLTPGADPIHKVTIVPRGMSLGVTQQLPIDDRHNYTRDYLLAMVTVLLGGRAAEEIVLGSITTGAGNDLERATEIARKMVCEWGMSEKLGPLTYGRKDELIFLGRDFVQSKDYSDTTARLIDQEVKRIVSECHERARSIIQANRETLERLATALLKKEVLDGPEIEEIIQGKNSVPDSGGDQKTNRPRRFEAVSERGARRYCQLLIAKNKKANILGARPNVPLFFYEADLF
ncbi:MAG: ATP-dependent zinc metalloprotease FtsH [Proteobacteria bacterium]|nr:ATP-dependent zinc metalloprotease FtsH [Pseudomonadota bacterium]